jgi:hypothetical protein
MLKGGIISSYKGKWDILYFQKCYIRYVTIIYSQHSRSQIKEVITLYSDKNVHQARNTLME